MSRSHLAVIVAVLAGLASGPWALESARAAQPPLDWSDLPLMLLVCFVGAFFIVGFQVATRQARGILLSWGFMTLVGVYFLACGIASLVIALVGTSPDAAALLFVAIGAGTTAGATLCKLVFPAAFANRTAGSQ